MRKYNAKRWLEFNNGFIKEHSKHVEESALVGWNQDLILSDINEKYFVEES